MEVSGRLMRKSTARRSTPTQKDIFEESSPERTLWLNVILQFLMDLTTKGKSDDATKRRSAAQRYYTKEACVTAQDFEDVCALGGVSPEYVRSRARELEETKKEFVIHDPGTTLVECDDPKRVD